MIDATLIAGLLVLFALVPLDVTNRTNLEAKVSIVITGSLAFLMFAFPMMITLFADFSKSERPTDFAKLAKILTFVGFLFLTLLMITMHISARMDQETLSKMPS